MKRQLNGRNGVRQERLFPWLCMRIVDFIMPLTKPGLFSLEDKHSCKLRNTVWEIEILI